MESGVTNNIIMENLIRWAKLGDVDSQFELGVKYFFGTDTRQDYSQAFIWFQKAAQQGHGTAQYNLAQCYEKELGVVQDYSLDFIGIKNLPHREMLML